VTVPLLTEELREFLKKKEFVSIATCDDNGRPNVAPKFLIKVEGDFLYLADYVIGRTFQNMKVNPKVSIATADTDKLVGYQINGTGKVLESGEEYFRIFKEVKDLELHLSVERIISGIKNDKKYSDFELTFPDRLAVFKIKITEVVRISPAGILERKLSTDAGA